MGENKEAEERRAQLKKKIEDAVYKIKPVSEGRYFRGCIVWEEKTFCLLGTSLESVWTTLCDKIWKWEANKKKEEK